jgi:phage RecT family recombinase
MGMLKRAVGGSAGAFAIGIVNAVNTNPELLKCEMNGLLTAGLTAAQMNLSLSPAIGHASIVPFSKNIPLEKDKNGKVTKWGKKYVAQFIVQVRGLQNLALRTNQYIYLNDFAVYASQTVIDNQMTGVPTVTGIMDTRERITHYGAYLKLTSGYEHAIVWTVEEILQWGKDYSPTYDKSKGEFNPKSKWVTNFDGQARKTVMKFLINHHGVISERDKAFLDAVDERPINAGPNLGELAPYDEIEGEVSDAETHTEADNLKALDFEQEEKEPAPVIADADRPGFITPALCVELGLSENEFSAVNMLKGLGIGQKTTASAALPFIRKYRAAKDGGKSSKEAYVIALNNQ